MKLEELAGYSIPRSVANFPSMMTADEKKLLYWLAKEYFRGDGMIIDAGVLFGASTNAFAVGLRENRKAIDTRRVIKSYDMAIWFESMDRLLERDDFAAAARGFSLKPGGSFAPLIENLLAPHQELIEFHFGDIVKTASVAFPVEIAFFDCLKTNASDLAAFRAFAPYYIPGRTIVIQQDYFYEGAVWNKIRQEYFAHHFEYLGSVATSAVFRLKRKLPKALMECDPIGRLSTFERRSYLEQAVNRAESRKFQIFTELALVEFYLCEGYFQAAREELDRIEELVFKSELSEITRRPQMLIEGFRKRLASI